MNSTKTKFALPNLQLQNAIRLTELTSFQRLLLISISDLCQKYSVCFANEKHLLFRLGGERKNLERGIKKLFELGFIDVKYKRFSNGKGFSTERKITLKEKSLKIFRDKNYLKEPEETFQSPDETLKSFASETPESHITYKEPITEEHINFESPSNIPYEIASAISSDTKSVSEENTFQEQKNSEKENSISNTESKQKFESFAPESDFELLAHRIIKLQENDGFAVSELLSNSEKVQQLLERTDVFLNGDFYKFDLFLKEQVQKYILQNLLKMSSNN
jgi:hypothetical protein